MAAYRLVATWRIAAPLQQVFDAIVDSLRWPAWWPGVDGVEQREEGAANGIGSVRRYIWKGWLPYRLCFDARVSQVDPLRMLEATVHGDLDGRGRWTFSHHDGITIVHYEWQVHTTKCWMNIAAPAVRSIFARNHHALMHQGAEALAGLLNASLIDARYDELPAIQSHPDWPRIDWPLAMVSGIVAGIAATIVQLALWWAAAYSPVEMLLRDSRLAAAIMLGPEVLLPTASFEWRVMLTATLIHFVLSLIYGMLQAIIVAPLSLAFSLLAGCLFGFLLFGINMYGFTVIFPWFGVSRDWITAAAHGSFGIAAAAFYKLRERQFTRSGDKTELRTEN